MVEQRDLDVCQLFSNKWNFFPTWRICIVFLLFWESLEHVHRELALLISPISKTFFLHNARLVANIWLPSAVYINKILRLLFFTICRFLACQSVIALVYKIFHSKLWVIRRGWHLFIFKWMQYILSFTLLESHMLSRVVISQLKKDCNTVAPKQ